MRVIYIVAVGLSLGIAGCTPYVERVANTCDRIGYTRGTPEFRQCMQDQMNADQASQGQWLGVAAAGFGVAAQPAPQPRITTTQCRWVGGTYFCNGVSQ